MPLGEGFHGESEGRAALRFIASQFGLPLKNSDLGEDQESADNPLVAD